MKTAARILLSAALAAIVNLCAYELLRVVVYAVDPLFAGQTSSAWLFTISGCALCYLPALLTGMIVARLKELFRPTLTGPLGVMAFWAVLLGFGAIDWPYAFWTMDRHSLLPWLFNYWTSDHCFPSLFIFLSTGLVARLAADCKIGPQEEKRWLMASLVICNAALGLVVVRYFFLPYLDHDEVEQSHVLWLLSQGILPYRDIHQIHMPLLWMLAWPVMHWLPHTFEAVLTLRSLCAATLVGSYVAGLLILREILGTGCEHRPKVGRGHGRPKNVPVPLAETKGTVPALVLLMLVLAVVPEFQFYLFRPDPFMILGAAWGMLAAVRMRRAPTWYSFWCGVAFGVAASFSIRLSWLCFLVPVVSLWECGRQRTLRPLWLVLPNGLGFACGILPVVVWIAYHGVFSPFWGWVVVGNAGSLYRPSGFQLLDLLFVKRFFATSALLGGLWLLGMQWGMRPRTRGRLPTPCWSQPCWHGRCR